MYMYINEMNVVNTYNVHTCSYMYRNVYIYIIFLYICKFMVLSCTGAM